MIKLTKKEIENLNAESIDNLELNHKKWLDKNIKLVQEEREQLSKREYKELLLCMLYNEKQ